MNEGLCNMAQMGKRSNILATGPNYKKKGAGALKPLCMSFGACAVSRPESKDNSLGSQVFVFFFKFSMVWVPCCSGHSSGFCRVALFNHSNPSA